MRILLALVLVGAVVLEAAAQSSGKVWRVGYLGDGLAKVRAADVREFRAGMLELGYVEGRNLVIEERWTEGNPEERARIAAEFVRNKVDVIVTHGSLAALAAKAATTTIPIVVAVSSDFLTNGLVKSLAQPGGNVTGLTDQSADFAPKLVQVMKEALPRARVVGLMWDSVSPNGRKIAADMQTAATQLGLTVAGAPVASAAEIGAAMNRVAKEGVEALLVVHTPLTLGSRKQIADLALANRIPLIAGTIEFAEAGALIVYGSNLSRFFRQAATVVDKVFKGTNPANLPVQQPTRFEFVVNMKAARTLQYSVPPATLARADRVID